MSSIHVPILVEPITEALVQPFLQLPESSEPHWLVDCTFGGGGHTAAFLNAFQQHPKLRKHRVLGLDQDLLAIQEGQMKFKAEISEGRLELLHMRFGEAREWVQKRPVLALLADLGFSSDQVEDSSRGISFQTTGPLDMRLDQSRGMSCRDFLAQVTEKDLEALLREVGEERFSKRIAAALILQRSTGNLPSTTQDLVQIVVKAIPSFARHGRIHAATRTFQALRIAVNEELSELDHLLDEVIPGLKIGGRVAIISFHSLEDRRVKYKFKNRELFSPLTKKPIQADEVEVKRNPRSRSAKLRIAERVGS